MSLYRRKPRFVTAIKNFFGKRKKKLLIYREMNGLEEGIGYLLFGEKDVDSTDYFGIGDEDSEGEGLDGCISIAVFFSALIIALKYAISLSETHTILESRIYNWIEKIPSWLMIVMWAFLIRYTLGVLYDVYFL